MGINSYCLHSSIAECNTQINPYPLPLPRNKILAVNVSIDHFFPRVTKEDSNIPFTHVHVDVSYFFLMKNVVFRFEIMNNNHIQNTKS